ncbi:hypothetical protein HK405_005957, partial [Cladochytrium tenue]
KEMATTAVGEVWVTATSGHGGGCDVRRLAFAYPLRLVSPGGDGGGGGGNGGRKTEAAKAAASAHRDVYVLNHGGGLLGGDRIALRVRLDGGCSVSLLTQGSTKVYRARPAAVAPQSTTTMTTTTTSISPRLAPPSAQLVVARVDAGGLLCVLPDPTTLFGGAAFEQRQRVTLCGRGAGVVLLDWFTSGRRARGEAWRFAAYESAVRIDVEDDEDEEVNEDDVEDGEEGEDDGEPATEEADGGSESGVGQKDGGVDGSRHRRHRRRQLRKRTLFRDAWSLRDDAQLPGSGGGDSESSYAWRVRPYHCFATLVLAGGRAARLARSALVAFAALPRVGGDARRRRRQQPGIDDDDDSEAPPRLVWTASPLVGLGPTTAGQEYGAVVRVAGVDTWEVREFLKLRLAGLEAEIGAPDLFSRAV